MAKIYLDPGHGGNDSGAVGHGLQEKDLVLDIALYTRDYLRQNYQDLSIRLSRTDDTNPSLSVRAQEANRWEADLFVSIHINSGDSSANGYEDYIHDGNVSSKTQRLQNHTHAKISPLFRTDRGKMRANFAVLRMTNMPAVLTENGFITNKADADYLQEDSNLREIGEAHADAIAEYLGLTEGKSETNGEPAEPSPNRVEWVGTNDKGKELEIIVPFVNYYDTPRWSQPTGTRSRGFKWKIDNLYRVDGSLQYRVQDANGNLFYTTAREDLVQVGGMYGTNVGANLHVDGYWGRQTTTALQSSLGTVVDGEIWGQVRNRITTNITGGVIFGSGGSPVIRALQRKVGATVDGYLGVQTFRSLQSYLGTPVDGEMWKPSPAVRELQRRLNAGTFYN